MGGFLLNEVKPIVIWSISVVNSLRVGVLLFIDGPALVCRWVNFSDPVATHPRTNEVEVPPRGVWTTILKIRQFLYTKP